MTQFDPNTPRPGFYKTRLVKNGPYVPVKIVDMARRDRTGDLLEDSKLCAIVNGERWTDLTRVWPYCARDIITGDEYRTMLATTAQAPHAPAAEAREPVDFARVGHNAPPVDDDLLQAQNVIEQANDCRKINNPKTLERAIDIVKQITALSERLRQQQAKARAPFDKMAKDAAEPFADMGRRLGLQKSRLKTGIHNWRTANPQPTQARSGASTGAVRTNLGAVARDHTAFKVKITDPSLIERDFLIPDEKALLKALRARYAVNPNQKASLPGCELEVIITTVVQ